VSIFDSAAQVFRFHAGPVFSAVVLADEINGTAKTQSALLEAMEERQVSQDGETRKLPEPFFVIATQNPVEQIGANPLPESQLDRFLMAIELAIPMRRPSASSSRAATAVRGLPTSSRWLTRRRSSNGNAKPPPCTSPRRSSTTCRRCSPRAAAAAAPMRERVAACRPRRIDADRRGPRARADRGSPDGASEDVQRVFPAVAGHRLAGGARTGALQAQALLRAVAIP